MMYHTVIYYYQSIYHGPVAQWLEQGTHNPLAVGSNPTRPTNQHEV